MNRALKTNNNSFTKKHVKASNNYLLGQTTNNEEATINVGITPLDEYKER